MLLRLTPAMEKAATEACAPLVARLDNLIQDMPAGERHAVTRFLERVADAAEQHADRLARDAAARAQSTQSTRAVPLPALWG